MIFRFEGALVFREMSVGHKAFGRRNAPTITNVLKSLKFSRFINFRDTAFTATTTVDIPMQRPYQPGEGLACIGQSGRQSRVASTHPSMGLPSHLGTPSK